MENSPQNILGCTDIFYSVLELAWRSRSADASHASVPVLICVTFEPT